MTDLQLGVAASVICFITGIGVYLFLKYKGIGDKILIAYGFAILFLGAFLGIGLMALGVKDRDAYILFMLFATVGSAVAVASDP